MKADYKHIIDDYLAEKLSPEVKADFEHQLSIDKELQEETQFQKQIVEGIKLYRKQQLKARFADVVIPPPAPTYVQGTGVQWITGVAATAIIGLGIYFFLPDDEKIPVVKEEVYQEEMVVPEVQKEIEPIETPLVVEEKIETEQPTKENIYVKKDSETSKSEQNPTVAIVEEVQEEELAHSKTEEKATEEKATTDPEKQNTSTFTPSIVLPDDVSDIENDEGIVVDPIAKELFEKPKSASEDEQINIEVGNKSAKQFTYVYFDGKLTLNGDFSEGKYQILEVIGQEGKDIYLFYNENYYHVELTSELKPLEKITNQEKIQELEILKNHK